MKKFNKIIAVICSATMVMGSAMTAFATEPDTVAGDGNILAFSIETVTLPTSVKLALNPYGYDVTTKTGTTSDAQIVSLNYGIISTANKDRDVTVSFTATGVKADGRTGTVEFVDTKEKAEAKSSTNTDGAEHGEYKIYLDVAAAKAAPKKAAGTEFAVTDFASESAVTATKTALADTSFEAATKGHSVFSGNATKAETAIAYKLDKATYTQKDTGGEIDFTTTQAQVAEKFALSDLGDTGVVGFTFTGAMNSDADWTKAEITALKIQPEYEIVDSDGKEEAEVTDSGLGQIKTGASSSATSVAVTYDSSNTRYEIALASGVISDLSDITNLKVNGNTVAATNTNSGKTMVRVSRDNVKTALGSGWSSTTADTNLTFTFTVGTTNYTGTVKRN